MNISNNQVIEDLTVTKNTDEKLLHRLLSEGVKGTQTILYYRKKGENLGKKTHSPKEITNTPINNFKKELTDIMKRKRVSKKKAQQQLKNTDIRRSARQYGKMDKVTTRSEKRYDLKANTTMRETSTPFVNKQGLSNTKVPKRK